MDGKYRRLLQQQFEAITKDLDVSDIQDRLFERGYFTSEEYERINGTSKTTRADRTRELLQTLIHSGSNAKYEIFVDSLAKDYEWLWEKLKMEKTAETDLNESYEDVLSKGNVPRLPDHHVKRAALESEIAEKLKKLARHKILALYGMSGSGKTCVAISTLRYHPELITDTFNGVVLWLNLANCKTEDDIIAQQSNLFKKTSSTFKNTSSIMILSQSMSSIGSNGDSLTQSSFDLSSQDLKDKLKAQFGEPPLKESLLVLDEVNDRKCLDAFDIGCKILVTTRDKDVIADYQPQVITIKNHFQEAESLELFASFLDEPVSRLPRQAKKLHELCTGSPFHIHLIGAHLAENKERLKHEPNLWDQFVKKLRNKDYNFFSSRLSYNPTNAIEMCINSLDDNVKTLYKKLAILPNNVKVSAKVLAKLWNKPEREVTYIMHQLKSKSLIIANYVRETKCDMYEIHDLIMNYLRESLGDEEKRKLHDKLLNSYHLHAHSDSVEIIDDGYIAFYLGYHILNTNNYDQKWSLFKRLFLDLKFLGNKVRLTGPADVIHDLRTYESYIVSDELERDLLQSIKAYLMSYGSDLHRYQLTDIIQSILQHETKGILYTKALEIAHENCHKNELYFLHEPDVEGIRHSTIDVKEGITCVSFLDDYVLVGTNNGIVKSFHNPTNKLNREYIDVDASRGRPVKWIGVAVKKDPIIAVLYENGTIKLWNIDDIDTSDSEDIIEEEPDEFHNNNVHGNVTIPPLRAVHNCRWSANEDFLITHTDDKIVKYSPTGDMVNVFDAHDTETSYVCCVPCNYDRYVAAVVKFGLTHGVEVIDLSTGDRVSMTTMKMNEPKDILALPDSNNIITLTSTEVTLHTFTKRNGHNQLDSQLIINSEAVKSNLKFLSFVVNQPGTLLFVSTDDSRVVCVDLNTMTRVFDLDNMRGNIIAMAVSEILMWDEFLPGYDVLLTGTGTVENTAKVWHLDTSYLSQANNNGKVRLTTKFDVSFLNTSSPITPITPSNTKEGVIPKRHQSFNFRESPKKMLQNTKSLDRQALKPLNLKGLCNNNDTTVQPLLAVIDDRNCIQVMRGRKLLKEICENVQDPITTVRLSPCNQHVVYGLTSGCIKQYTFHTRDITTIAHVNSPVHYMKYVNPSLLIVAGEKRCLIACKLLEIGRWEPVMLQKGNASLGSQELLHDFHAVKKKYDALSLSESRASLDSRERTFSNERKGNLCKSSSIVECFWLDLGLVTVENNARATLWDKELKLVCVLNPSREDADVTCATLRKNVLVICGDSHFGFQTLILDSKSPQCVKTVREQKLMNAITCCDLTADGNQLALGLDSGDVLLWNVKNNRQMMNGLLRHHKSKVHSCAFSPVPERAGDDDQPPLVLLTMATEMLWWNVTYHTKQAVAKLNRLGVNVNALTPLSPSSPRVIKEESTTDGQNPGNSNFFFADGFLNRNCWKDLWKNKTYKQGSKRKEILACIKLSGIYAKRLCHDDRFSCFVTVDNTGLVYIMNVLTDS